MTDRQIISLPPDDPYSGELYKALNDYNASFGADTATSEAFLFAVKDEKGETVGGAQGRILSGWLTLYSLHAVRQGEGIGTQLMDHVEDYARRKNCKGIHLTSFEFQAPEFYKKRGYVIYGELDDYAAGYKDFYLKKVL